MTTSSPALFPENGARKLSPKETMQRMKALSCTLPKENRPTCSGQVHVGIFFDGTGNNMKDDFELPPQRSASTATSSVFFILTETTQQMDI